MRGVIKLSAAVLASGICMVSNGCKKCGYGGEDKGESLAELVEVHGKIERDRADRVNLWEPAKVGARFMLGDGVRAGDNSSAVLKLKGGSKAHLKSRSMIRFLRSAPGSNVQGLDVEMGETEIVVGEKPVELKTRMGSARLKAGSRISLRKAKKGIEYRVKIGKAVFESKQGKKTEIGEGERIVVGIGMAVLARFDKEEPVVEELGEQSLFPATAQEAETVQQGEGVSAEVKGSGVRMRAGEGGHWTEMSPGASGLAPRTTLNLPENTSVRVRRKSEMATLHGKGEFEIGTPDRPLVKALKGKVSLETKDTDVAVVVPGGVIIARGGEPGGTSASVDVKDGADTLVRTDKGRVDIEQPDRIQSLRAGEQKTIAGGKSPARIEEGPKYADLSVRVGGSFTIHAPKPPVVVQFRFEERCPYGGVAQLLGKEERRSRGEKSANLLFTRGRSRYLVRCLGRWGFLQKKIVARGTVLTMRDSGRANLPRSAPVSTIEADGRHYSVSYQNQLPVITFRWPQAPSASSYSVILGSEPGGSKRLKTAKPTYVFKSGTIGDGMHRLQYEAAGASGRKSKPTTLEIRFDNAAPKASLREPADGSFRPGQTVRVAGVAVPGWKISLNGGTISVDDQHRFTGEVAYTNRFRAIALRLVHKRRGVHYYLRRAAGKAP